MIVCMRVALICSLKQHIFLFTFLSSVGESVVTKARRTLAPPHYDGVGGGPLGVLFVVRFDQKQITLAA